MHATQASAKRQRTKPAEIRREELMDAAQAVFLEKGFDSSSVDEIVSRAGVAKGTFYLYFKTKDDILLGLRERFVGKFHQRLSATLAKRAADDWSGRLDAWVQASIDGYLDELPLHDLVFHETRPSNAREHYHENPVVTDLAALLAEGSRHGAWAVSRPRLAAAMLASAVHGAVDEEILATAKSSRRRLVAEARRFCRGALGLAVEA